MCWMDKTVNVPWLRVGEHICCVPVGLCYAVFTAPRPPGPTGATFATFIAQVPQDFTLDVHVFWDRRSRNGRIAAENAIPRTSEPIFHISANSFVRRRSARNKEATHFIGHDSESKRHDSGQIHLRSDFFLKSRIRVSRFSCDRVKSWRSR